jgi:cell division septal protein FtsQ
MKSTAAITLRGETDFLRRQNNRMIRKQKKLKTIKIKGIHLFVLLIFLSSVAFGIYKTGRFVLSWEKLNVKSFRLINCPPSKLKEVKNILGAYYSNILVLNLDQLRTRLGGVPEVRDAFVSRILPSTVEIKFLLREPVFQFENKGKYNIIDKEGIYLYKNAKKREDLITVKNVSEGQEENIIPYLSQLNSIKNYIDYVGFKQPYGIILKLKGVSENFYPGEIDFADKINYYLRLREKLSLNKNKIKNVDLRFKDRFYLEFEEEVSRKNEK